MSIIRSCEARLNDPALGEPKFRLIGVATDLAALKGKPPAATPAGFLFMAGEEATPNERATGPVLQTVSGLLSLLIIARNLSGSHGGGAADEVEVLKADARRRLVGFTPEGAEGPLELEGGEMIDFAAGSAWWEERYAVDFFIQEDSGA